MTPQKIAFLGIAFIVAALGTASASAASAAVPFQQPAVNPQQLEYFESKIRPILAGTCQKCHGPEKQKGGLRLDSREAVLRGGESGPVVIPGKPEDSPLIEAVNYRGLEMPPPPAPRLKERETSALVAWIKIGRTVAEGTIISFQHPPHRIYSDR